MIQICVSRSLIQNVENPLEQDTTVQIQVQEQKQDIGLAGSGNMKLNELFSPIGAPKDNEDVNWPDDLRVFVDNDNDALSQFMFPAIKKHETYKGHPDAYKLYIKPLEGCRGLYASKFHVEDCEQKIPRDVIILMAKKFAAEQDNFMERGDYEN